MSLHVFFLFPDVSHVLVGISDKDEKLVRDVSPSQGLLQSAISQTEEAPERAKRLSPISRLCLIFYKFLLEQ